MEDFVITIPIPKGIADIKLPDPDLVSYYENLKNRIIIVDYEIDETLLNTIGSQILEYNRQDKGIPVEQRKKIVILINSEGGVLASMLATIAIIERSKTPVVTVNMHMAHSAAGLLLLAGHERYCMPRSQMLIHSGSGGVVGNYEEVKEGTKSYKRMIDETRAYILEKSEIPKTLLARKAKIDWFLTTEEQLKYNCVNKILDDLDEIL